MTKQKVGLTIFWIGVIWTFFWLVLTWAGQAPAMRSLTMDELNQTIWAYYGPLSLMGAIGVALGALIIGIGILLYARAKGSIIWGVGIGIFVLIVISVTVLQAVGVFPLLFGIGGTLILLSFIGIIWFWAKERMALEGSSTAAADLKLVGYLCMLIAVWFVCGIAYAPFRKAVEELAPSSPLPAMLSFVLGWLFLFLSHYKARKQQG